MPFDQAVPLLRYYPMAKLMYLYKDASRKMYRNTEKKLRSPNNYVEQSYLLT